MLLLKNDLGNKSVWSSLGDQSRRKIKEKSNEDIGLKEKGEKGGKYG